MNLRKYFILILIAVFLFIPLQNSYSQGPENGYVFFNDTDSEIDNAVAFEGLVYFFDLRERETFIQLTYDDFHDDQFTGNARAHVQIFDVNNNCNENDFFDVYTINDTHVYNMREIQTNDGSPSGVVLPDGAYGIVVITLQITPITTGLAGGFGNMRILDNNGYEYRTNAFASPSQEFLDRSGFPDDPRYRYSFNFNSNEGVTLSDVIGINLLNFAPDLSNTSILEWDASDVPYIYTPFDIDIYDLNEVPFSCRDVIYSCVDEDNPRLQELLETAQSANVASFEYGINNAIPHSKGGELLCPGNTVTDGIVNLTVEQYPQAVYSNNMQEGVSLPLPSFFGFVGLNNGNSRGSFDSFWVTNKFAALSEGN